MSVLTAANSAGIRLLGRKPGGLFSTDTFGLELGELATEAAVDIARAHDWQKLLTLATIPGDGVTIAFDLPSGYDRMPKKEQIHSATWRTANFRKVRDLDEWIYLQQTAIAGTPGSWILLGGKLQIFPAMPASEAAKFYFLTNKIINGAAAAAFTADADTFDLSERVLALALIWRWRAQKRMEYAEDMANYELALSQEIAKDRGSNVLTVGATRVPSGVMTTFPGVITP